MRSQVPPAPPPTGGVVNKVIGWLVGLAMRLTLLVSPVPAALLVRRVFATTGGQMARRLQKHVPPGISVVTDERYGDGPDALLDVVRPDGATGLPLVVWIHGGGWVGGSKDEIRNYLKVIAGHGYVVASPSYSLAPEHRYPTPLTQVMAALAHLASNADRHGADADHIILAGDSAGAHVAAQIAALTTTPGYADAVGVRPTVGADALRAVVLACGPYSVELAREASSPAGRLFIKTVMWAYSRKRDFLEDPTFRRASVVDNVSAAFPPALVTVGNADPLRQHSELLVDRLHALGVEVETVFWPADHEPPLGHEYQFDLNTDAGQAFRERLVDFLARRAGYAVTS